MKVMKVLHVSNMDGKGGAALGAYGLHRAMLDEGVDSTMLVIRKTTEDPTVLKVNWFSRTARLWMRRVEHLVLLMQQTPNELLHTLNVFPTGIHRQINKSNADIVQLHWISMNAISVGEIARINKPVVWKMPDMWAFSGAEHYTLPGDPERYKEGYTRKNRSYVSSGVDVDRWMWLYKIYRWKNKTISIVGTSNWIAQCAKESVLFRNQKIKVINNPIDLRLFKPVVKSTARHRLGLPQNKRIILFGAWHVERDRRKGYDKLLEAIRSFGDEWDDDEILLLVFGASSEPKLEYTNDQVDISNYDQVFLGELSHDEIMRDAYAASDVFVMPSLLEGFGLTAAESLACSTPVVCFDTSGLKDIVDHKVNGYRANCYDSIDLAAGITWVLKQDAVELSRSARGKAERSFGKNKAVASYLELYKEITR